MLLAGIKQGEIEIAALALDIGAAVAVPQEQGESSAQYARRMLRTLARLNEIAERGRKYQWEGESIICAAVESRTAGRPADEERYAWIAGLAVGDSYRVERVRQPLEPEPIYLSRVSGFRKICAAYSRRTGNQYEWRLAGIIPEHPERGYAWACYRVA